MSEHVVRVVWERGDQQFSDGRYSREHQWCFDGGAVVQASASPSVVPAPYAPERCVDPEEAFVAALSSCHMLWFLDLARREGFVIDSYVDRAVGHMTRTDDGNFWISRVELDADIRWAAPEPDADVVARLHHVAHEKCFIANSVKTEVIVGGAKDHATQGA